MKLDLDRCTCLRPDGVVCTDVRCPVHWPPWWEDEAPYGLAVLQAHLSTGQAARGAAFAPGALAIVEEWEASGLSEATACSIIRDVGEAFARRHRGDRRARIRSLGYYRAPMAPFVALAPAARHSEAQRAKWEKWRQEHPESWRRWLAAALAGEEREEAERDAARAVELERRRAADELRAQELREIVAAAERRQAERAPTDASADLTTARRRALDAAAASRRSP